MTPSGMRGVLNDAVSIYFLDATLASAFVARWCAGYKVETANGMFHVRADEPLSRVGAGLHRTPQYRASQATREQQLAARTRSPSPVSKPADEHSRELLPPPAPRDEALRRASAAGRCQPSAAACGGVPRMQRSTNLYYLDLSDQVLDGTGKSHWPRFSLEERSSAGGKRIN